MGSHEMAAPSNSKKFIWPNDINSGCFHLHISQNVARSMPSFTSQLCGDSLVAVCLARQVEAILQTTRAPMDTRQAREWGLSKSRPLNLWQWYKYELLVYCCTYQMTVKSDTWNCVHTRPLLVNPVTYKGDRNEHFCGFIKKAVDVLWNQVYSAVNLKCQLWFMLLIFLYSYNITVITELRYLFLEVFSLCIATSKLINH